MASPKPSPVLYLFSILSLSISLLFSSPRTLGKETKKRKLNKKPKSETPNKKTKKTKSIDKQHLYAERDSDSEKLSTLLEPYSKEHLIDLICDAAAGEPSFLSKATGKAKGYGFVLFKTRKSATKALMTPQKKINSRVASCQLASLGNSASTAATTASSASAGDSAGRKIYVTNIDHTPVYRCFKTCYTP